MRARNFWTATAVIVVCLAWCSSGQAGINLDYQKNGVHLSWIEPTRRISGERLSSSEIAGYNIFRSLDEKKGYRKINDQLLKDTKYIDRSIEWGNCYYYTLTTVDTQGLESPRSSTAQAVPPLSPPANVQAFGLKRSVMVSWNKTNNPQIRGYNVYRSETAGRDYQSIAAVLDTEHEYVDRQVVAGKNYYYRVSTVDISWQQSDPSPEVAARPLVISQEELSALEKVNGFRATVEKGTVILDWEPIALENLAGYNIYRRSKEDTPLAYQRLNTGLVTATTFRDEGVKPQKSYYYLIAAVDKDKNEARFPKEIYITVADLYINSLVEDSGGHPLRGGSILTVTMIGTAKKKASASLDEWDIPLKETDQKGVYYGQYLVPKGINRSGVHLVGVLESEGGEKVEYVSKSVISIDNLPPDAPQSVKAETTAQEVCLSWKLPEGGDDIAYVEVFRSLTDDGQQVDKSGSELISGKISVDSFCDQSIQPHQGYFYYVRAYDQAGNSAQNRLYVVTAPDYIPPKIYAVKELSSPGLKHLGDIIRIQMLGEAKAKGKFSIGRKIQRRSFQELGAGRYVGEYRVQSGDDLESEPVVVELVDASGNQSILVSDFKLSINTQKNQIETPSITSVEHNAFQLDPLVAGDKLRLSVEGQPGCSAYADLGATVTRSGQEVSVELNWAGDRQGQDDVVSYLIYNQGRLVADLSPDITHYRLDNYQGDSLLVTAKDSRADEYIVLSPITQIPLPEIRPGFYEGTYEVKPGDRLRDGSVSACLISPRGGVSSSLMANSQVTIDTSVKITVTPREKCLAANARTEIQVEVRDAKDIGVANREIAMELFTTDEYTGLVGVGHLDENKYGHLDNFYQLITDPWGRISVPYVSGSAAKTAIIRATDKLSHSVGLGYVTSYIEGLISIELIAPPAPHRGLKAGPSLVLWTDRTWLTADGGHSSTVVHARVVDAAGRPVEGHEVKFLISLGGGWLKAIQSVSDGNGETSARYLAGKQVGTVQITAIDTTAGLSKRVSLTLKSDAPAKVEIRGLKDGPISMRADGVSTTDLIISVSDINGNPSRGVPLEVEIIQGGGKLIRPGREMVTDFHGEVRVRYLASTRTETVIIRARAISRVPDSNLLDKIRSSFYKEGIFN